MYHVSIQGDDALPEGYEQELARAARVTLALEGAPADSEVSVALTGEEEIRRLNREYRDIDSATDVLSFEMNERLADGGVYLGDVIVAVPVAKAQAEAQGHDLLAELTLLVVHGVLHLLGEDHAQEDEKAAMWAKQKAVLEKLNVQANPSES